MLPNKPKRNLVSIVEERPFTEFSSWWKMGDEFIRFLSTAIISQWKELDGTNAGLARIQSHLDEYLRLVYDQAVRPDLLKNFVDQDFLHPFYSGEFDALSYAFYRSAFETISKENLENASTVMQERRKFTKDVGNRFFSALQDYLQLDLPTELKTPQQFLQIQNNLALMGEFLIEQGYLREQCDFTFSVDVTHADYHILQKTDDFLDNLFRNGTGYALYIMSYPAIFPSAVYLYQIFGEAQHHSSRTIEKLFEKVGCIAHETADFDPSNFPSERVVELWSISYKG